MDSRFVLAQLPGSRPYERLQVSLVQARDGGLSIDLREQHYADGIGWFDQRSLSLEPGQLQRLQAVLGPNREIREALDEPPATLPFPGPRESDLRRPAVGEGL